jgi:hypothetical protein
MIERVLIIATKIFVTVLAACGIYWSFFGPPVITIRNDSSLTLNKLQIQGEGFSLRVPQLNPNEKMYYVVYTEEENQLKVEFLANGATKSSVEDVYFERAGGHCVTIIFDGESKVSVDSGKSHCFSWRRMI